MLTGIIPTKHGYTALLSATFIVFAALNTPAFALESTTVGTQTSQANVSVLDSKIGSTAAFVQDMMACSSIGKFYTPGHAGADSNGCWSNSALPSGTIAAFAMSTCPTGWSEYTAARGKFLRGMNGSGVDPDGNRSPGAYQADAVGPHNHYFSGNFITNFNYWAAAWGIYYQFNSKGFTVNAGASSPVPGTGTTAVAGYTDNGESGIGPETRPKNIAVLFCMAN